ncbi:ABC transporter ATP-binding protein [Sphingobacterium hungaricum]|uniref:ABC transporter ATP-binding protein n=1 Tax=Sphingobacterium hungaricum TaxID=2082723 RepID=A0A928YPS8_9SPHI|nr:ABC transporter ATP-binding protein [Sphingobacterium hungaricum]MBE8713219.1 ABC transporter ATP-binding protein [Sphingobacterium hungaricum]
MIVIKDLSFYYRKDVNILEKISTTLKPGHVYGLLGLNGTGKTTFLKLIAGLQFPKIGDVTVNKEISKERNVSFLLDIYFITDEVELPKWKIKTFEEVYGALYPKFDSKKFYELLTELQVNPQENLGNLSYGQQKKVNIAFGLSTNVSTILMDEPTNGLDIPSKSQFRKLLAKYTTDDKIIVISTHQTRDLDQLIDQLLVIHNRQLVVDESIYDLTKKIKFENNVENLTDALYFEKTISGLQSITENKYQEDSKLDIELFFNALTQDETFLTKFKTLQLQNHE